MLQCTVMVCGAVWYNGQHNYLHISGPQLHTTQNQRVSSYPSFTGSIDKIGNRDNLKKRSTMRTYEYLGTPEGGKLVTWISALLKLYAYTLLDFIFTA